MAQVQVTTWRDLPSMVIARRGEESVKVLLPARFQEAIDEAAMRLGESDATAYLDGWGRSEWEAAPGDPATAARARADLLEALWSPDAVSAYLEGLGASADPGD